MTMTKSDQRGFYFFVGQTDPSYYSFVWRVWTGGTSFYIKPRWKELAQLKISLHGPDPRPGLSPIFKLARDRSAPDAGYRAGTPGFLPCVFPGREVGHDMIHAVRIAVPADTFAPGKPWYGPAPTGGFSAGMKGACIDVPAPGSLACVDLYVSPGPASWPGRQSVEADNAIVGDLTNAAGQHLVGISAHLEGSEAELPDSLYNLDARLDEADVVRGVAYAVDPRGFVWICERILSVAKLEAANEDGPRG